MTTKEVSSQPASSFSKYEQSFEKESSKARRKVLIMSSVIVAVVITVLVVVSVKLGSMSGEISDGFSAAAGSDVDVPSP